MSRLAAIAAERPAAEPDDDYIAPVPRVSIQAFCESHDVGAGIAVAAEDRRMAKAHLKIQTGGIAAALEAYRNAPTPNVVLIEHTGVREELLDGLDRLAESCDSGTKVIVIGRLNDVQLYRELIRRGVSDYLIAPIDSQDVIRAVSGVFTAPNAEPVGRTLAVVGAKGGAGASTIAHNIAWSIARDIVLDTVVVDFDLPFGTAGLDYNQDPPQGIADAMFAPERVDSALIDRLLSKCADHLSVMAAPATLERTYDFDAESTDPVLDVLRTSVPWIVLDVPHLWTNWARRALISADHIVIVAMPDLASLRNAKNLIDLLRTARPNDRPPLYLLNQVGVPKRPEIRQADFAKALDAAPLTAVPFEPQLFGAAANNGQMIAEVDPKHRVTEIFRQLAQTITGKQDSKRAGASAFLLPMLEKMRAKLAKG